MRSSTVSEFLPRALTHLQSTIATPHPPLKTPKRCKPLFMLSLIPSPHSATPQKSDDTPSQPQGRRVSSTSLSTGFHPMRATTVAAEAKGNKGGSRPSTAGSGGANGFADIKRPDRPFSPDRPVKGIGKPRRKQGGVLESLADGLAKAGANTAYAPLHQLGPRPMTRLVEVPACACLCGAVWCGAMCVEFA